MGIYDDPRAGVANSLMQQQTRSQPFNPGPMSNSNSLFAGGAPPPQGGFGMSNANSIFGSGGGSGSGVGFGGGAPAPPVAPSGGMGMAGGGVVPQQPQMGMPMGSPFAQQQALQLPPMG